MADIRGVYAVVPTPFDATGDIDMDGFRAIVRSQIDRGCRGVVLFGIASEFYKLAEDEERALIDAAADECEGAQTALIVSVTKHATRLATRRARYAVDAGANGLMILPPYFLGPTEDQIIAHVRQVAGSVDVPVIVQYAPIQTGVSIRPEAFVALARSVPSIACYKVEARPPGPYISALADVSDGTVDSLVGYGGLRMIEAMDRGAVGVMPGCSLSDLYRRIEGAYRSGDRAAAARIHRDLIPLLSHLIQDIEMFIHYEKQLLVERGIIESSVAHCRHPSFEPDDHDDELFQEYYRHVAPHLDEG